MVSGPSSNPSTPVKGAADSPDILPLAGYTMEQLTNYIQRQLGSPVWNVELTQQQIMDHIQDALSLYSQWLPTIRVGNLALVRGQYKYMQGENVGLGVVKVDFVEPNPVPTEIFYGNLINPAPLFRVGIDEYDIFLRWRKTWQRVTSIAPDWFYDELEHALYIHNPIERYQAAVFVYWPYDRTEKLPYIGADWVKRYALAKSKLQLAELWMKFSGAIPGPGQNIQLDQAKREQAVQEIDKLVEQLKGMALHSTVQID